MDHDALFVLYRAVALCYHKRVDVVFEKRLGFPKAIVASAVTVFFTTKLTFALCHIPLTYPKIALANNKT